MAGEWKMGSERAGQHGDLIGMPGGEKLDLGFGRIGDDLLFNPPRNGVAGVDEVNMIREAGF